MESMLRMNGRSAISQVKGVRLDRVLQAHGRTRAKAESTRSRVLSGNIRWSQQYELWRGKRQYWSRPSELSPVEEFVF